jgi:flagellar FliL protein
MHGYAWNCRWLSRVIPTRLAEEIHQDILAYVHTMKLYNLRGGSGFQHLMEDLDERAAIRSDGRVKRVLVRSMILE